jgi:hypothetical protein
MNHFANNSKEYFRKVKDIKKKKGDEPLTQEEIDILFNHMSDDDIDRLYGIKRKPGLGCLILVIGSILFWGFIAWLFNMI